MMVSGARSKRQVKSAALACLSLIVVTLLTYAPVVRCDFVNVDDPLYVTQNPVVPAGLTWGGLAYAWSTAGEGNYIPITWMTLELDATLFGVNATGFHVVNVIWHVLNVCLLYAFLLRTTGAIGCSAAVALLFAVHPLHVESVAWISERKDVVSTFWLLVTLLLYEHYARSPSQVGLIYVAVAMGVGLLAKSMLVTLPVLLLFVDFWPLCRLRESSGDDASNRTYPPRTIGQLLLEKVPLLALSFMTGVITIVAQKSTGAMQDLAELQVYLRPFHALHAYGWYLWKTFWPTGLCAYYPLKPLDWSIVAASFLALLAISWLAIHYRERRHLLFGWLWFVTALLPVCGILQVGGQAYADRYTYVPHIGLLVAVVWEVNSWFQKRALGRRWAIVTVTAITATLAVLCSKQVAIWRNSETLWTRALQLDPENYKAHANLGVLRLSEQDLDGAEQHLRRAVELRPNWARAITHLGWIHQRRQEMEKAEACFQWALRINPEFTEAQRALAQLRRQNPQRQNGGTNRPQPSAQALESNRLGLVQARAGDLEKALSHFQEAIASDPEYAAAHNNAALALTRLNQSTAAERHLRLAIKAEPDNLDFHVNLAVLLEARQQWDEALGHYQIALRLNPHDVEAQQLMDRLSRILKNSAAL